MYFIDPLFRYNTTLRPVKVSTVYCAEKITTPLKLIQQFTSLGSYQKLPVVIQKQDGKNVHPKISAELVGMKKKLGKSPSPRLQYCSAPTPEDHKCFAKNSGNFGRTSNG